MQENKYYERKIKYLDYREKGERIHGAGFVKIEIQGEQLRIAVTVKNLHPTDTFEKEVLLLGIRKSKTEISENKIGKINIKKGMGEFFYKSDKGFSAFEGEENRGEIDFSLVGIRIKLGNEREISGWWGEDSLSFAAQEQPGEQKTLKEQEKPKEQIEQKKNRTDSGQNNQRNERNPKNQKNQVKEQREEEQPKEEEAGKQQESPQPELEAAERTRKHTVRLFEDKWKQLSAIYPHIRPFRDSREYLSITPSDFVLLSDSAYRKANNSFLLHGYYNYGHLILTRLEKKGDDVFYIGVPGNFYEREKQVALLFGFESFECAEEPAQAGDFGYYMMRTQL